MKSKQQLEKLIFEQQEIQGQNPPTSTAWVAASKKIHELAAQIVAQDAIRAGKTMGQMLRTLPTWYTKEELQVYSKAYAQIRSAK